MDTLYLTDLDGTLLDARGRLSARSARGLAQLACAGVAVSVATGRAYSALDVLEGAPLGAPLVLLGGARLYDARTRRILSEHTLQPTRAQGALDALRREGFDALLYTQDADDAQKVYYERNSGAPLLDYVARLRAEGDGRFCAVERLEERFNERMFYLTAQGETARLQALVRELSGPGAYVYLYYGIRTRGLCSLEITPVSKRAGVEELRAVTGCRRIVAFGDNGNDAGLFEAADVRVAVDNATPEIRAMADLVIGRHDEDAVVRCIAQMEGVRLED